MPRFFFHLADVRQGRDDDGVELPDAASAREEATAFLGEVLKHDPRVLRRDGPFRVEVTDATGRLLWTVVTNVVDATEPALRLVKD